jgi:hypothetical protein
MVSLTPRLPDAPASETAGARLADRLTCARVGSDAWSPLPGVEYTGVLLVDLPASTGGAAVLIVADRLPLDLEAETAAGPFPVRRERLRAGPGIGIPPDLWLEAGGPWTLPPVIARVTLRSHVERDTTVEVSLGRRAPRVLARLTDYAPDQHATVCAGRPAVQAHADGESVEIGAGAREYFASGWAAEEPGPGGTRVRRMREFGAVLVPSDEDGSVRIHLRAAPLVSPRGELSAHVSLRVNDIWDGEAMPMRTGVADYQWRIPSEVWVAGVNELLFSVSRLHDGETSGPSLGLTLHSVRVTP